MYIDPNNRFTEIHDQSQDFRAGAPLAKPPAGPSTKEESGDSDRDPYQLDYAGVVQNNKKAHSAQLKIELNNTGQALEQARAKVRQDLGNKMTQKGQEIKDKAQKMYKKHGQ